MKTIYADQTINEEAINKYPKLNFAIDQYFKKNKVDTCLFLKVKLKQLERVRYRGDVGECSCDGGCK